MKSGKALVVGAGIVGLTTAISLLESDWEKVIIIAELRPLQMVQLPFGNHFFRCRLKEYSNGQNTLGINICKLSEKKIA